MPEICFSETVGVKSVWSLWEVKKAVSVQMNEVYAVEEILRPNLGKQKGKGKNSQDVKRYYSGNNETGTIEIKLNRYQLTT